MRRRCCRQCDGVSGTRFRGRCTVLPPEGDFLRSTLLQMATFTITEKGYNLYGSDGSSCRQLPQIWQQVRKSPASYIGKVASLLYARFLAGEKPIAMVSMDNCSHNGDKLAAAITAFAEAWVENVDWQKTGICGLCERLPARLFLIPWSDDRQDHPADRTLPGRENA